ncbi:MAG: DUF4832 domain-containing protein [Anaerocolumna sp.]
MKNDWSKKLIVLFFIIFLSASIFLMLQLLSFAETLNFVDSGIDYAETTEELNNPERGYMSNYFINLKVKGSQILNIEDNFCHLFFNIGDFSNARNGGKGDLDFSADMLSGLNQTFKNFRENGSMAIIRFSYDGYEGRADTEPSMKQILKHITQLKPVFAANEDVIASVEAGFLGKWGEMHGSKIVTVKNINLLINALLDTVPKSRTISVRQPAFYANWLGININNINKSISKKGTPGYRIGIYNDGYLGSVSDLGTYQNRNKELAWLKEQAKHTFYGGEIPSAYDDEYYLPVNCIPEMSVTHTAYINGGQYAEWNRIYQGSNQAYKGKTALKYISDHLGYRFVLCNSLLPKSISQGNNLPLKIKIENTGFGNVINQKEVELILLKDNRYYIKKLNMDVTQWNANTIKSLSLTMQLPINIKEGTWKVYLRISNPNTSTEDDTKWAIEFANADIWNADLCANYLGSFVVAKNRMIGPGYFMVLKTLTGNMTMDGVRTSELEYMQTNLLYQYIRKKIYIKNDKQYLYILAENSYAVNYQVVEIGFRNGKNGKSYRTYTTAPSATSTNGYVWYGEGSNELMIPSGYVHKYTNGSIEYKIPLGTMFGLNNGVTLSDFYIKFMKSDWTDITSIQADKTYTVSLDGGSINNTEIGTKKTAE